MSSRNDKAVDTSADISNPREVQGTLALITVGGFIAVAGAAVVADIFRGVDPTPILNILAPLAFGVVAFYFGTKKAAAE
jgi:hypothetical protein